MKRIAFLLALVILSGIGIMSCNHCCNDHEEHGKSEVITESKEAHKECEGEEDRTMFSIVDTYDEINNGVRLILSYNKDLSVFTGSIENTTDKPIEEVRVEIHLSNGKELGPTTPVKLIAGEKREIELDAKGEEFDKWNTHTEIGCNEHSHDSHDHTHGDHEHSHDGHEH